MRKCVSSIRTTLLKSAVLFGCCAAALLFRAVPAQAQAFNLPDSDQRKCYRDVSPYDEIACAGTGQDGAYIQNPLSYTNNGNGTVTDNNTGLMWQKQDDGIAYNWYRATGTYNATYNPESTDVCGSLDLGGATDWRLPSKKERLLAVLCGWIAVNIRHAGHQNREHPLWN